MDGVDLADDPLVAWYDLTSAALTTVGASGVESSRAWAIAWMAARRSVRDIPRGPAATAAPVSALHAVLSTVIPRLAGELDAARDATLRRLRRPRAVARGVAAGALAATDMIADRADDGPDPARWRPWLVVSVADVAPPPPPAPDGYIHQRDVAELRELGGADSVRRTDLQTEVARFWARPALPAYIPALRASLIQLDAPVTARVELVALLHAVTLDAQIAGFAAGAAHRRRWPGRAPAPDDRWTPLAAPEPGEPDYPCLHTAFAGAAEITLTALAGHPRTPLGLRPAEPGQWLSPAEPGQPRYYTDWRQLTADYVDAGVWGGIHPRFAVEAGAALGRRVAFRALARWSH